MSQGSRRSTVTSWQMHKLVKLSGTKLPICITTLKMVILFYTVIPFFRDLREERGQRAMSRIFPVVLGTENLNVQTNPRVMKCQLAVNGVLLHELIFTEQGASGREVWPGLSEQEVGDDGAGSESSAPHPHPPPSPRVSPSSRGRYPHTG